MPFVELSGGRKLAYEDKGEGFPILFGHSYLWNKEMWRPQIEALSSKFRCIAPDLWGHGESDFISDDQYSIARMADDFLDFTEKLGLEEFAVVGLSVGGMWGMELTLKAPEKVKALVMMDTFVGAEPKTTYKQYFGMLAMIENLGRVPEPLVEQIVPMFFSPVTMKEQPELSAHMKQSLLALEGERVKTVVTLGRAIFGRPDRLSALKEIKCPAMFICGQDDMPRPPAEAELMAAEIAGSKLEIISEAGHICNLEKPDVINLVLRDFLI